MMVVMLSFNEVQSMARKAAVGAGLPHGVAEDVGHAAMWLSARGVDGLAASVQGLENIGQSSPVMRAAIEGLAAIDALCAGEMPEGVMVDRVDAPLLLIGLAGIAAATVGIAIRVEMDGDTGLVLSRSTSADPLLMPRNGVRLRLISLGTDTGIDAGRPAMTRPVAVDDAAYRVADKLAARTYVPASETSRTRGAGAEKSDND